MTRPKLAISLAFCAVLATGCAGDDEPEGVQSVTPEFVAQIAAITQAIARDPAATDSILAAAEMTRVRFDSLLFEVALDPDLTEAFEAARR